MWYVVRVRSGRGIESANASEVRANSSSAAERRLDEGFVAPFSGMNHPLGISTLRHQHDYFR